MNKHNPCFRFLMYEFAVINHGAKIIENKGLGW